MGKAYSEDQRASVKILLEAGRDEDSIEKETGVSDRTIRRWKLELERTGRIGKVCDDCVYMATAAGLMLLLLATGESDGET